MSDTKKPVKKFVRGVSPYVPKTAMDAIDHVINNVRKRWPEGESLIASHPVSAYQYALRILMKRWSDGEKILAQDSWYAYVYARNIVKGRWPEGEKIMATDPYCASQYAMTVTGRRFEEGEPEVAQSLLHRDEYLECFPEAKDDWAANGWIDWMD